MIIIELRPAQIAAIAPGFQRWSDSEVGAPFHRRAVVERSPAGAAVIVGGILVASGEIDENDVCLIGPESCLVAAVELGSLSGNPITMPGEFSDLAEAGGVWLADLPVKDLAAVGLAWFRR